MGEGDADAPPPAEPTERAVPVVAFALGLDGRTTAPAPPHVEAATPAQGSAGGGSVPAEQGENGPPRSRSRGRTIEHDVVRLEGGMPRDVAQDTLPRGPSTTAHMDEPAGPSDTPTGGHHSDAAPLGMQPLSPLAACEGPPGLEDREAGSAQGGGDTLDELLIPAAWELPIPVLGVNHVLMWILSG